jgi:hypothetical protein
VKTIILKSESFAALENLKQDSRDISRAWEHIEDSKK